jgi:hypothetical protein
VESFKTNDFKHYPYVSLPYNIKKLYNEEIPVPYKKPIEPHKPSEPKADSWGCLIIPVIAIGFSLMVGMLDFESALATLCIVVLIVFIYHIKNKFEVSSQYQDDMKEYASRHAQYRKDLKEFELLSEEYRTSTRIMAYRLKESKKYLYSANKPEVKTKNKEGSSEKYFGNYLCKYFSRQIFTGYGFKLDSNRVYVPDFIYQNENGLHIDIEIDEPYSFENLEPIHFLEKDASKVFKPNFADWARDHFFNDRNWIVIRFAEEQVVCYPRACCQFIAKVIDELTGDLRLLALFKKDEISPLKKMYRWNEKEAENLVKINYRLDYLSIIETLPEKYENTWNDNILLKERNIEDDLPF